MLFVLSSLLFPFSNFLFCFTVEIFIFYAQRPFPVSLPISTPAAISVPFFIFQWQLLVQVFFFHVLFQFMFQIPIHSPSSNSNFIYFCLLKSFYLFQLQCLQHFFRFQFQFQLPNISSTFQCRYPISRLFLHRIFFKMFVSKDRPEGEKTIVFLSTCASVDFFSKTLSQLKAVKDLGLRVEGLHGRMVQKRRTAVRMSISICAIFSYGCPIVVLWDAAGSWHSPTQPALSISRPSSFEVLSSHNPRPSLIHPSLPFPSLPFPSLQPRWLCLNTIQYNTK